MSAPFQVALVAVYEWLASEASLATSSMSDWTSVPALVE